MTTRYYVVREDLLPEAIVKTIGVKDLLARGGASTIHEAVEKAGMSRSAFYKYKDGVYSLSEIQREHIVTLSMDLEHRSGVLSSMLGLLAKRGGNVLTINQSIPLQGMANVMISLDTASLTEELDGVLDEVRKLLGIRKVSLIGQG